MDPQPSVCRICAETTYTISAYSEAGEMMNIKNKVRICLGLNMTPGPGPWTSNICLTCLGKLNLSYELYQTSVEAQQKLMLSVTHSDDLLENVDGSSSAAPPATTVSPENPKDEVSTSQQTIVTPQHTSSIIPAEPRFQVVGKLRTYLVGQKRSSTTHKMLSPHKNRKTVCIECGEWVPRTDLVKHEREKHSNSDT